MSVNVRMIAVTALLVTTIPFSASARQTVKVIPSAADLVGFVIEAEPEVVERASGVLRTRAIYWRLRARYRSADGYSFNAVPKLPPRLKKGTRDTEVLVKRAWNSADRMRRSGVYTDVKKAVRDFRGLRMSGDSSRFGKPVGPIARVQEVVRVVEPRPQAIRVVERPVERVPPAAGPVVPPKPVWPRCKDVLIERGHASFHLSKCKGIPNKCAVTLLESGHSPIHLNQCKSGQNTQCMMALLRRGHSPIHLDRCMGLKDGKCAVKLLERGDSPIFLDQCK